MGLKFPELFITVLVYIFDYVYCDHILSCDPNTLFNCTGNNQICMVSTLKCECLPGFILVGEDCELPSEQSDTHHNATAVVVSIFTLALLVCGLVLVIKKYKLIEYARQKWNSRNTDVMYEDVMIGQDDPPLSP